LTWACSKASSFKALKVPCGLALITYMCFNHIVERGIGFGRIISWLISKVGDVGFKTFGRGQGSQTSIIEVTSPFAGLQDVLKCINKMVTLPFRS